MREDRATGELELRSQPVLDEKMRMRSASEVLRRGRRQPRLILQASQTA